MGKISVPTPATTEVSSSEPNPTPTFDAEGTKEKAVHEVSDEEVKGDELDVIRLARKLDVEAGKDGYVRRIVEWAKDQGMDFDDLSDEIKLIQYKIGNIPEDGRSKRIWEYIQLQGQARQAIAKLNGLEN